MAILDYSWTGKQGKSQYMKNYRQSLIDACRNLFWPQAEETEFSKVNKPLKIHSKQEELMVHLTERVMPQPGL